SVLGALRRLLTLGHARFERGPGIGGAIVLNARDPQTRHTVALDHALPAEELLNRKAITLARFFEADEPAANRSHDLRLAANDPAPGLGWRQIGQRHQLAIGADDLHRPRHLALFRHLSQSTVFGLGFFAIRVFG